ncbi:MAG TPA: VanW family protein, partial [Patescibacteria group bacterium]|nr:VanW family protein [Patescibacteria group bacterium]
VVERRNHSYRVSYYEPPVGMDATIYEPKPDFRFSNDYTSPLLLQARIEGNNLIFEFYGTKDDRVAGTTTPRVFNVVRPGPKKIIETDTLPPGQTKCIEKPHNGSDAEFTYTVTYPNGETKKETFKSHYKPWQEVCLVGKAATPKTETQ